MAVNPLESVRHGVCAVLTEPTTEGFISQMESAFQSGASLVELRLDYLTEPADLKTLMNAHPGLKLVTIRRKQDGGIWEGDESLRLELLQNALANGAHGIDIEEDCFSRIKPVPNTTRILSYHNFQETPGNIQELFRRFTCLRPDIIKIACKANSILDWFRLRELYLHPGPEKIAFCMGSKGYPTRIMSVLNGAPWLYASHSTAQPNAPGIPSLELVQSMFPLKKLGTESKIFGVVGDPISHSLSPAIHNNAFEHMHRNDVYLPFHVNQEEFTDFYGRMQEFPLEGLSVTIPHKETAACLAGTRSPLVQRIGAANTLIRRGNSYHAENTDALAIVQSLKQVLGKSLGEMPVLILGAGGAARAGAFALSLEGCPITITNRNITRAKSLANEAGWGFLPWEDRFSFRSGILLQCTSLGMHPNVNDTAWELKHFTPQHVAFDTVYNPLETRFLQEAKTSGAICIPGMEMFIHQAAAQFELFTGLLAPLEKIRDTAFKALTGKPA